jgi:sensor histidine kinase YesM
MTVGNWLLKPTKGLFCSMLSGIAKYRVLLLHLIFWSLFISYQLYDYTRYLSFEQVMLFFLYPMSLNMAIGYLHYFLFLPFILNKRKPIVYLFITLLAMAVFVVIRVYLDQFTLAKASPDPSYYESVHMARMLSILWGFISIMVFTSMIKLTANWYDLENKRKQLENEKLTAELNHLKSQINPHFLFNTLHNLNYLTMQKSDEASAVIIKLSNIMRYMIYEANKHSVPIANEISYMRDYIALEQIRLNNQFELDFDIKGLNENIQIAPLLLITFLENAFKHGVSDRINNCWIKVELSASEKHVHYKVSNSKVPKGQQQVPSGFGLNNLKKRLNLQYPDKHKLLLNDDKEQFNIDLTIELT